MDASSLAETLAEMLLTGAVDLDDDFDDISEVLSAVKALATPGPGADHSHLILPAAAEARLTPVERYGLDRALEAIGIGDGGADERLAETLAVADSWTQIPMPGHGFEILTAPPTTAVEQEGPTSTAPRSTLLDQPGERPTGDEPVAGEETIDTGEDRSAPSVEGGRATETPPEEAPIPREAPTPKQESDDSTDQSPPPGDANDDEKVNESSDPPGVSEDPPEEQPTDEPANAERHCVR